MNAEALVVLGAWAVVLVLMRAGARLEWRPQHVQDVRIWW